MEPQIQRVKRNRDKSLFRMFATVAGISLVIFFWLNIAGSINLEWYSVTLGYIFLVGLTTTFIWLLKQEKEPDSEEPPTSQISSTDLEPKS